MMTIDELFNALNQSDSIEGCRTDLRTFLLQQLEAYNVHPEDGEQIAYQIAGLMNTRAVLGLEEGDPYEQVFALAGDLELPPAQRDKSSTWERFAELVHRLPEDIAGAGE